MNESKETKKTKSIAFRLTDEEYAQAERAAMATGDEPNNWCRELALTQSREGLELTKNERLIYEEIARVRYLRRAWIQAADRERANYTCNLEEDNGGRRPEFGDHRHRSTLQKAIAPTASGII